MKLPKKSVKVKNTLDVSSKSKVTKKQAKGPTMKKSTASLLLAHQSVAASGGVEVQKHRGSKKDFRLSGLSKGSKVSTIEAVSSPKLDLSTEKMQVPLQTKVKPLKSKKSKKVQSDSVSTSTDKTIADRTAILSSTKSLNKSSDDNSSSSLNRKLLEGVCAGTLQLTNSGEADKKKDLFGSLPQPINLQVTVHKVPQTPYRMIRCLVPHSTNLAEPDICLIVPDLQRGRKRDTTFAKYVEQYEEKLRENGTKGIKQIIPFTQLRCEYNQFEMKRRLAHTFDLFLCDGRIQGHCYHFLGTVFQKAKKIPVPIQAMTKVNGKFTFSPSLQNEVDNAVRKVSLTLHSYGTSYSIPVGHSEFTADQLSDNVQAVWKVLDKELPGGVKNIRAAYLKGPRTCAVPLYASLEPPTDVPVVKSKQIRQPVEDDLSTLPGRRVIVYPTGDVKIADHRTPEDFDFAKLNPRLAVIKGTKKRKISKSGSLTNRSKPEATANPKTEQGVGFADDVLNENASDDGGFENVEDAENAYLSQWSESVSLRQLENEEEKDKLPAKKRKKNKKTGKGPSGSDTKVVGKKGISQKYSGKAQKGKNTKQQVSVSKAKSKKRT